MAFQALSCRQVQRAVDAFADGELSQEGTLATQAHLARCPACRRHARWQQTLHDGTRRAVHGRGRLPRGFEHRVRAALEHERLEEATERVAPGRRTRRYTWLFVLVPLASLVLVVVSEPRATHPPAAGAQAAHAASASLTGVDDWVDAMIGLHAAAPTMPKTEPFRQLERDVGLPVQAPPELARQGATWLAATSSTLGDQRVASLAYRVAGHRCTLFLYDDRRVPVRRSRYLSARAVDQRPVFAGMRRGYAIAAVERRGLGYALASDLDLEATARLVAAIH